MDFSGYASETPLWGDEPRVDFKEIGKLNIPAVLPWPMGKGHPQTDRAWNRKSLLVELPEILLELTGDSSVNGSADQKPPDCRLVTEDRWRKTRKNKGFV